MGRRRFNGGLPAATSSTRGPRGRARPPEVSPPSRETLPDKLPGTLGNQMVSHLLESGPETEVIQPKLRSGPAGDAREQDADRAASAVVSGASPEAGVGSSAEGAVAGPGAMAPTTLLVDDDVAGAAPGQMRKSDFLAEVRRSVCATADEGLAASGQSSDGCPWIQYWLGYYDGKDASHVESALRKFVPEAGGLTSARDFIPMVASRVRRGVDRYAQNGEISEVPTDIPGSGLLGGFGEISFKGKEGGARGGADPAGVRGQLGAGQPLETGVRSQMESAFGVSFSHVRLHTDQRASTLSNDLNARAFTVGEHVAFGEGEYRPGSIAGQALLAHELAHVVQQGGVAQGQARKSRDSQPDNQALEADADASAIGAMKSLLGGFRGNALPAIRSGLGLHRCSCEKKAPVQAPKSPADAKKAVEQAQAGQTPAEPGAPAACPVDPAVTAAKATFVRTFGFASVGEDPGCCWTVAELGTISGILQSVPGNQRADLAGLILWRVKEPHVNTEQNASAAYNQLIVAGARRDRLEIGDKTFTLAGQSQQGSVRVTGDPNESRNTALHEVGHAMEAAPERLNNVDGVNIRFTAPGSAETTVSISRRMAEFVALVVIRGINIAAHPNVRNYVKNNWPANPGELFADLYRISLTDSQALQNDFGADFVSFFTAPIGPKPAATTTLVNNWIQSHLVPP